MWKTVIILGCCAGAALASPLGTAKDIPMVNDEFINEKTEMAMSTLNLPSNATSIRADITDGFSCDGRLYGYYADIDNDCQIFHVCLPVTYPDGKENTFRWSFICPDETLFSQESFTCVRTLDMGFDCAESMRFYDLNRNFGMVAEMDLEMHDLLRKTPTDETRKDLPESSKPVSPTTTAAPLPTRRRPAAPNYKTQPAKPTTQAPIVRKKPVRVAKPTTPAPVEIKPILNRDQYMGTGPNVGLRKTVIRPQATTMKPVSVDELATQLKTTATTVMEEEMLKSSARPVAATTVNIVDLPSQTEKAIEQFLNQQNTPSTPTETRATEAPTQAMNSPDEKASSEQIQMTLLKDENLNPIKNEVAADSESFQSEDSTSSASNENKYSQELTVLPDATSVPLVTIEAAVTESHTSAEPMDKIKSETNPSASTSALSSSMMAASQPEVAMEMKDTTASILFEKTGDESSLMGSAKPGDQVVLHLLNTEPATSRPAEMPLAGTTSENSITNEHSASLLQEDEMNVSPSKDLMLETLQPVVENTVLDSNMHSSLDGLQDNSEKIKNAEETTIMGDTSIKMNEGESDNQSTSDSESLQIEKTSTASSKQNEEVTEKSEMNPEPLKNWFIVRETTPKSDISSPNGELEMTQPISGMLMEELENINTADINENAEVVMQQSEADSMKSDPAQMTGMKVTVPQNPLPEFESNNNVNPDMQNTDIIKVISSLVNQAEQDASMKMQDNLPSVLEMRLPLPNEMAQLAPQTNMNLPLGLAPHSNMNNLMATPALLDDPMFIPVQVIMDKEPLRQGMSQPELQLMNPMENNAEELKVPSKESSNSPNEETIKKTDETKQPEEEVTQIMLETNPVAMKENIGEASPAVMDAEIPLMSASSDKLMDEASYLQMNSAPMPSESQTVKLEQPSSQPTSSMATSMSSLTTGTPDALTLDLGSVDTKPILNQIMDLALNLVKSESMSAPAEELPVVHDLTEAAKENQNDVSGNFSKSPSAADPLDGTEMAGVSDPEEIPMAPEPIENTEQQNDLLRVVAAEKIGELVERTDLPESILNRPDQARSLSRDIDPRKRRFLFKSLKNSR